MASPNPKVAKKFNPILCLENSQKYYANDINYCDNFCFYSDSSGFLETLKQKLNYFIKFSIADSPECHSEALGSTSTPFSPEHSNNSTLINSSFVPIKMLSRNQGSVSPLI